jgi:L-ascorbate metabolism protein UlaG (beta-lactamase superfamily)
MHDVTQRRRRARRALRVLGVLALSLLLATMLSTERFVAFGASPSDATLTRMRASPRFAGDHFTNAEPTELMKVGMWASAKHWFGGDEMRAPTCALPLGKPRLDAPPASGLRITWLGHSTTLLEIDGTTILTDPNWSERSSPSRWVGPKRFHPPPLALADLPRVDAVVISHEHFDHLDMATVRALGARGIPFHVPLGIGPHLALWGVPATQIVEHDWWERTTLPSGFQIVSTPARHFNGRGVPGRIGALWTSWSLVGAEHRVFFSGDTGMTSAFAEIRTREGPFDVALLEIGQHHPDWGDIHLGPNGAVEAWELLGAKALVPIHWGTFELAYHGWSEPAETTKTLADARGLALLTPRIGESIEPGATTEPWWRALPPLASRCP